MDTYGLVILITVVNGEIHAFSSKMNITVVNVPVRSSDSLSLTYLDELELKV